MYFLPNKVREISFKIIHRYYPVNQYFPKFKKNICVNCSLCEMFPDTMVHLVWQYSHRLTTKFWKDVSQYIVDKTDSDFCLCRKDVGLLFGLHNNKSEKQKELGYI